MALSPCHSSRVREAKYSGHDGAQGECPTVLEKQKVDCQFSQFQIIFNPLTWTARSEARHCSTRFFSSITSACMSPITLIRASTVPSPRLLVFLRKICFLCQKLFGLCFFTQTVSLVVIMELQKLLQGFVDQLNGLEMSWGLCR